MSAAALVLALVAAQTASTDITTFVARARAGTERYHELSAAIADGYRALGPDAPGMGVHWVNVRLAIAGRVDAARPAFLTYITVAGRPALAGTGYVVPLGPGEEPPEAPAGRHAWHFHSRSVIQESVAPGRHTPNAVHEGPRVAVLHAWVWRENPDGVFAPENWALPYYRLGLEVPARATKEAAQALALASDEGSEYYADRLHLMSADHDASAEGVLRRYEDAVRAWLTRRGEAALGPNDLAWLADTWQALSEELRRTHPAWGRERGN